MAPIDKSVIIMITVMVLQEGTNPESGSDRSAQRCCTSSADPHRPARMGTSVVGHTLLFSG